MTRTVTTFDTMPQAIDLILKRMDEIEAKLDAQPAVSESAATHIFLEEAGKIPAYKNGKQWNFVKEEPQGELQAK